jgi:hypothetical protein
VGAVGKRQLHRLGHDVQAGAFVERLEIERL